MKSVKQSSFSHLTNLQVLDLGPSSTERSFGREEEVEEEVDMEEIEEEIEEEI